MAYIHINLQVILQILVSTLLLRITLLLGNYGIVSIQGPPRFVYSVTADYQRLQHCWEFRTLSSGTNQLPTGLVIDSQLLRERLIAWGSSCLSMYDWPSLIPFILTWGYLWGRTEHHRIFLSFRNRNDHWYPTEKMKTWLLAQVLPVSSVTLQNWSHNRIIICEMEVKSSIN